MSHWRLKGGVRMRPILTDVVANERLRARLGEELIAGKLSHAYILSGGIKKYTDEMKIESTVGVGTTMYLKVYTN